jgi:hypothetical protein
MVTCMKDLILIRNHATAIIDATNRVIVQLVLQTYKLLDQQALPCLVLQ